MTTPLPIITGVWRLTLLWNNAGGVPPAANVIHLRDAGGTANANGIYAQFAASVNANMWFPCSGVAHIITVQLTKLDGSTATSSFSTGGGTVWTGGQGAVGDIMPAPAALVTFYTALRGRRHRGRIFLPFVSENGAANGALSGTVATNLNSGWASFLAAIQSTTPGPSLELVVASYGRPNAANPGGWTPEAQGVIRCNGQTLLGTQRRRQSRLR